MVTRGRAGALRRRMRHRGNPHLLQERSSTHHRTTQTHRADRRRFVRGRSSPGGGRGRGSVSRGPGEHPRGRCPGRLRRSGGRCWPGLSVRFTDQPQRWAVAPALFMGVAGVLSFLDSDPLRHGVLAWVWPPALLGLVVWMIIRARRDLVSRTRRWVVYPVLATLTLVAVGAGYETARESADTIAYPAPGQLVDVGGHRLHLNCTGSGSPTVVLEPGLGETSMGWAWIAPAVAADTRVCVYDRAGRGWSEAADDQQRGADVAAELHTLLHRGNVPGPYVLAGHSFGGLYVRSFAAQFPDEVAGMVLVDSTAAAHPTSPTPVRTSYDPLRRGVSAVVGGGPVRGGPSGQPGRPTPACRRRCRTRRGPACGTAESLRQLLRRVSRRGHGDGTSRVAGRSGRQTADRPHRGSRARRGLDGRAGCHGGVVDEQSAPRGRAGHPLLAPARAG